MTDLLQALPDFPAHRFSHLLPSLDRNLVTLSDLLALDATDVARRAQLPPGEVRKLTHAALAALHAQLGLDEASEGQDKSAADGAAAGAKQEAWQTISALDDDIDAALGGGFPLRYLSEVVGESGAGKTQLLLTLLLAVQLPPSHGGLSAPSVYISTESALNTNRLSQMLRTNPRFSSLPVADKPSLNRILTLQTPDLESQDHILRYQLPVAIRRHGVRLVVIDSIAANYRAELDKRGAGSNNSHEQEHRKSGKAMAARRAQLLQLGALLRDMAQKENVAIVVANQVADRFHYNSAFQYLNGAISSTQQHAAENGQHSQPGSDKSLGPASAPAMLPPDEEHAMTFEPMTLDHQQRWFTGWGDVPILPSQMKTPSLGLVWTNQIAARVALIRQTAVGGKRAGAVARWMRVVFAAWAPPTEGKGLEIEIYHGGVRAAQEEGEDTEPLSRKRKVDDAE